MEMPRTTMEPTSISTMENPPKEGYYDFVIRSIHKRNSLVYLTSAHAAPVLFRSQVCPYGCRTTCRSIRDSCRLPLSYKLSDISSMVLFNAIQK